jgi:hypothetical protein
MHTDGDGAIIKMDTSGIGTTNTGMGSEIQILVVSFTSYPLHFSLKGDLFSRGNTDDRSLVVVHHDHRIIHKKKLATEEHAQLTPAELHADLLFQLAREIRELIPKLADSKGRKYSYEEWTKFIHLLNHDASKKDHISTANWSWLDDSSPLFRHKNETEWILEKLSERLEEELKKDTNGRDEGKGITEE